MQEVTVYTYSLLRLQEYPSATILVLGIGAGALGMLSKCSTTELHRHHSSPSLHSSLYSSRCLCCCCFGFRFDVAWVALDKDSLVLDFPSARITGVAHHAVWSRLPSIMESSCLCLPSARTTRMYHHVWLQNKLFI